MMTTALAKMLPAETRAEILFNLDRFLRQTINDEEIFMTWLEEGVPDGTESAAELADIEAEDFVDMWQLAERLLNEEMGVETPKGPCEARGCGYFYKDEDDERPRCHCPDDGFPAPCEEEDYEPDDIDDDEGYNPYTGCMDWDC